MNITKQNGFTLIELVVVIVILGILSVTAAPKFLNFSDDARLATAKGTKGALSDAVQHVHLYWQLHGNDQAVGDMANLHDGSYNINSNGYPIEAGDNKHAGHANITVPSVNMCGRLWNNLLSHSPPLDHSGLGEGASGSPKTYYYTVDGGMFKVSSATGGVCQYSMVDKDSIKIEYNSNTGVVSLIN
ncbi:type IV pilin protein [Parasalinivibrio latis]|uniref:type IV pilin protein n=1 Tax=Parasalinivibrio latis TaxID=2952610 RepID=UPI003DA47FA1